ncbi:MAG: hypothetical protein BWY43_00796 [candidate division WS2 bacterium ADurb.Bin280]|uniref:Glycosyltransferase RgtA/B/C/D-like domain-containing protein n=1 Tax=candidate division WS2 bacterium ADurb.Bin280 TaxID=1852829 RepID=A0A1V5SBD5_9BACT|nr:MAG: hypothetical protein BWY43_00796 [candidate division WS2 bacterium ADurb.Bin280]
MQQTFSQKLRRYSKFYIFNLLVIAVFLIVGHFQHSILFYLKFILGPIFLFTVGLNLALALEQFIGEPLGRIRLVIWSILLSIFTLSGSLITYYSIFGRIYLQNIGIISFGVWLISIALLSYSQLTFNRESTDIKFKIDKRCFLVALISTIILAFNMFAYKFIPEADPYLYLDKIKDFVNTGSVNSGEARPVFILLFGYISSATHISPYWLFKIFLPLFVSLTLSLSYLDFARRFLNEKISWLFGILFLTFPVIVMEILISRPQSIFLLSLPAFIIIIFHSLDKKDNRRNLISLALILVMSIIGIKIHQFFLFGVLISLFALILFYSKEIRKNPLTSLLAVGATLLLLWPWAEKTGLVKIASSYCNFFYNHLSVSSFDLWFIDNYRNVDGVYMGWPGLSFICYYIYNLGLSLALLVYLLCLKSKRPHARTLTSMVLYLLLIIFVLIAEIFPRFGLAYLPDRAWLFISVTIPFVLIELSSRKVKSGDLKVLFFAILLASLSSPFLSYYKSGYVTNDEFEAAMFLKKTTSPQSLIISQESNAPMIGYFGNREFASGSSEIFFHKDFSSAINEIESTKSNYSGIKELKTEASRTKEEIEKILSTLTVKTNSQEVDLLREKVLKLEKLQVKLRDKEKKSKEIEEIYILYSTDKFESLYGSRQWWKNKNFYDADLSIFETDRFEEVFSNGGVKIWRFIQ